MGMQVDLYADSRLKDNVKYRAGGLNNSTLIQSFSTVANGAIANENVYAANSIELGIYIGVAAHANYIKITISRMEGTTVVPDTIIVGEIVGLTYINDANTSIEYTIDFYTSAQMTEMVRPGFFSSCYGLCERTNLSYPSDSMANLQSEPLSGSDTRINDAKLTTMLNTAINTFTGWHGATEILSAGYHLVLWISSFAVSALSQAGFSATPFIDGDGAGIIPQTITEVTSFGENSGGRANIQWSGGFATGIPIRFTTTGGITNFIDRMLSNVGERILIPAEGIDNDGGEIRRYATINNQGYFYSPQEYNEDTKDDMLNIPMEMTKIITNEDIFRIQIVPSMFCEDRAQLFAIDEQITHGYDLDTFNPMKAEKTTILPDGTTVTDFSKSKLLNYPYFYHEMETRSGNVIPIIPQVHWARTTYPYTGFRFTLALKFVGAENPKLLGYIKDSTDDSSATGDVSSADKWYTIMEYPNISWANNVSSQQQLGELEAKLNRYSTQQSALIGAATSGTGFTFGYRGGKPSIKQQGFARAAMTTLGNATRAIGHLTPFIPQPGTFGPKYSLQGELDSKTAMDNAGRIVTTGQIPVSGEGSIDALLSQPCMVRRCGATDGELFGFARFLERRGQTANVNINPITNTGDVFQGNAFISALGDQTYYEFYDLDVNGTMPIDYKNMIQGMFCGGCYLIG